MSVVDNALNKAVSMLNALKTQGVQFEIRYEGTVHGGLPVPEPEKKPEAKRVRDRSIPYGIFTNTLRPPIRAMQVGEVIELKMDGIALDRVQSVASSLGAKLHGPESCITGKNIEKSCIEMLRLK